MIKKISIAIVNVAWCTHELAIANSIAKATSWDVKCSQEYNVTLLWSTIYLRWINFMIYTMHDLHESILKLGFLNIKVQMNRPITFLTCDALKKTNKEIGHGDAMCTHSEKTVTIQTVPVCRFCSEEAFGKAMDARACCCCAQPLLVSFPFAPPHYQHNFNAKKLFFIIIIIILQRLCLSLC